MTVNSRRRPGSTRRRVKRQKKSRLGLWTTFLLLLLVAAYLGVLELSRPHVTGDPLRFDTWIELVETGKVKSARVLDQDSYVVGDYERPDGTPATYNAPLVAQFQGSDFFNRFILGNRIPYTVDQQVKKQVASLAAMLLPGMMIVVLFAYLILSARKGTGLFKVRSGARKIAAEPGGVSFSDVAGQEAAVTELREIKHFLSDPDRYLSIGAQIPKGVLLYGPPGCGKTLLARAVASEAGASFYSISGSDFVELYVGVGAARVRDLFKEARENAPAVIFIDELDSIGRARGSGGPGGGAHIEQEQALNQVLAEMDGFSVSDALIVMAATNRPDVLDQALLRPGRFDRTIGLELPDEAGRLAILSIHAREKRLSPDVDLGDLAARAIGLTGADLASVMNEGALLTARAGGSAISQVELDHALRRILEAPEHQRRLSLRDRSIARRSSEHQVTFADVAGQEAAVAELREIRHYLEDPEKYVALGATIPKGVLLYGPPGCGKTLLARALAGEANAAFFSVGASEFIQSLVGQGASRVRDLFAEAKQKAPAIVFIDELDSLGRSRAGVTGQREGAQGEQEQALNQILAELDGFAPAQGVLVLGATNRPDVLDPALLRPGRFDRTVGLELPNEEGRLAILTLHAKGKLLGADADLAAIADRAHGLTGADLANIMNEAALLTARADQAAISQQELDAALQRTLQAPERQRSLSMRSRSVGKRFAADERVTFADVAGVDDAVEELSDVKEYLANPDRFAALGATPPRGILLSGPPGCGKTLLARAVAGEANAAFISVAASEFVEVFVGEGAARVRDLFAEAKAMAPAIVFIDEIDAVGSRRLSSGGGGHKERESTLNQILVELDGFERRSAVIVVAATNRPDTLDPALVRPGRFDRKVEVSLPDRAGRRAILELHAASRPGAADLDLDVLAGRSRGFSGADLHNIINEAALLAARRGIDKITMALVDEALDRAYLGVSSRRHILSEDERRVVAYHEAGHALVALALERNALPYKITIVPRGGTLGHCAVLESHDEVMHTHSALMSRMAVGLGGWAAEKLVFGQAGSGAAGDLVHVKDIARRMVCDFGMNDELGPLVSLDSPGADGASAPLHDDVVRAIRALAEEAHANARAVLVRDRALLEQVVEVLLEQETVSATELEQLAAAARAASGTASAVGDGTAGLASSGLAASVPGSSAPGSSAPAIRPPKAGTARPPVAPVAAARSRIKGIKKASARTSAANGARKPQTTDKGPDGRGRRSSGDDDTQVGD